MQKFNVITYNFNSRKFEPYDIMDYLIREYKEAKKDLKTYEEFKDFVINESRYQFWSRCEYEIILQGWPHTDISEKWDVFDQIMMNIDLITRIFIENVNGI